MRRKNSMFSRRLLFVLIFISMAGKIFAQDGASLGLGNAYTAIARGTEAIFWNPANLALSDSADTRLNIKLWSFSAGAENTSFDINTYKKYIGVEKDAQGCGKRLTEKDKDDILSLVDDEEGIDIIGKGDASALAVTYKNFGVSFEVNAHARAGIQKDALRFPLKGFVEDSYDFNVEGEGYGVTRFNFSYGRLIPLNILNNRTLIPYLGKIKRLSIGTNISYISGVGYGCVTDSRANIEKLSNGYDGEFRIVTKSATGGKGLGWDLGIAMVLDTQWQFGFVIDNILGSVKWNKETKQVVESLDLRGPRAVADFDEIDTDSTYYRTSTDEEIGSFSESLPRNFRFGVARYYKNYLGNFEIGRKNKHTKLSLGGGAKFSFFELYAGFSYSEGNAFYSWAMALNFRNFYFDFGMRTRSGITGNSTKGIIIGQSIRIGF